MRGLLRSLGWPEGSPRWPGYDQAVSLRDQRRAYRKGSLDDAAGGADPLELLTAWIAEAGEAGELEPTAMALATVDPDGSPSVRYVLCKGITPTGVEFFTNTASRKGRALAHEPRAAVTFWWPTLERAVRLIGVTSPLPRETVQDYFASRPRGSRLGAWASHQSQPIESREALAAQSEQVAAAHPEPGPAGAPPEWGGYHLTVHEAELWQGRDDRLHDRLHYARTAAGEWQTQRLQP